MRTPLQGGLPPVGAVCLLGVVTLFAPPLRTGFPFPLNGRKTPIAPAMVMSTGLMSRNGLAVGSSMRLAAAWVPP